MIVTCDWWTGKYSTHAMTCDQYNSKYADNMTYNWQTSKKTKDNTIKLFKFYFLITFHF